MHYRVLTLSIFLCTFASVETS